MNAVAKSKAKERQVEIAASRILRRWGIESVRPVRGIGKEAVAARLGPIGVELWERATEKTTRLLKLVPVRESFRGRVGIRK